jgi:hypothetical protein
MEVEGAFDTKAIKEEGADTYCAVEELDQTDQTNSPVHLKKPTEAFGMIADVFEFRQNHRRAGARHWNDSARVLHGSAIITFNQEQMLLVSS